MPDETDIDAIERWFAIAPPNETARVALADFAALIAALDAVRDPNGFALEPSGFEQALRDCREPGR